MLRLVVVGSWSWTPVIARLLYRFVDWLFVRCSLSVDRLRVSSIIPYLSGLQGQRFFT